MGNLGTTLPSATAADISPDGRHILVRNKFIAYLYERATGQSVADALHGTGIQFTLGAEQQGEAIGWAADGNSFYTTTESNDRPPEPVYSYSFSASQTSVLPGDYNGDHVVDAADYTVWRNLLGTNGPLPNESETLGHVTQEDYNVWKSHFGESIGGGAGAITGWTCATAIGVPEPLSLPLATLAIIRFVALRKRR